MFFKLLFIISVIFSTFSESEIALTGAQDLNLSEVNLVTPEEMASPELDSDNPVIVDNTRLNVVLSGFFQTEVNYQSPHTLQLHLVNLHSRAPPTLYS